MNSTCTRPSPALAVARLITVCVASLLCAASTFAQSLINVDFGVGNHSAKTGFAAIGQSTNDFWNLYRHYDPKFVPGMPLVSDGRLDNLKFADGSSSTVSVTVSNAPGVWGNFSGDPMYDSYIFAQNGSNIVVTVQHLDPGRYHFYLYGHADPDVTGEQTSIFTLHSSTNTFGPFATVGSAGWKATSTWQERYQYVVVRDVLVEKDKPITIEVAAGANGVAVLNGLQIFSRGTSPPRLFVPVSDQTGLTHTNLLFREIVYNGAINDHEARFSVSLSVDSQSTNEISAPLFEGDVAVLASGIPEGLRIVNLGKQFRLYADRPGSYQLKLDVIAKITRQEPWNQISFTGPSAAIASVKAQAAGNGMELQLLSGTQLESGKNGTNSVVNGFLGADRALAMRWQSKTTEVTRKSLVTVDTTASAQVTPTVIKFTTQLKYEILQAGVPRLTISLPLTQALTRLQGEQIRDWQVKPDGDHQLLSIEFIKPVEKAYELTLFSEQTVESTPTTAKLLPPQPLEVERESGSFALQADEMLVNIDSTPGLRQVNASAGALAAYRFYGRPFELNARLQRIEPVVNVADHATARIEESRLLVTHSLALIVEKAGIYALEATPQTGFVIADVQGEGVEDWKAVDGKLHVNFNSRVLGKRRLTVVLEQAHKTFPQQIDVLPMRITGAAKETSQLGASASPGIRLKTGTLTGLREIPVANLSRFNRSNAASQPAVGEGEEVLAYTADQPDWNVAIATERLAARVVADIFNLVTIGDGLVGGGATIRYGIVNQGVQEFKVKLPSHWKNIEFTGANIRRKDKQGDVWTISLQDKAWGGYTLVVTYDYQFDPKKATLDGAGPHALDVERETGSVAITTAASLKLEPKPIAEPLHLIDQTELADTDRSLITRPVLLAYRYAGDNFKLGLDVMRHEELSVLDAVADRTQLTTVLTEGGEMLTQASFMVKNNDKQFQRFQLPKDARLWACYVNSEPVKGEQDKDWLMVSLPRTANRDQAFAVDIVYAQQIGTLGALFPQSLKLEAPKTDVPNTYAEWQLFVPPTQRLSSFAGNMTVAQGTTYGLRDAWRGFLNFYSEVWNDMGPKLVVIITTFLLLIACVLNARHRGMKGIFQVAGVACVVAVLLAMLLPAASQKKLEMVSVLDDRLAVATTPSAVPPPPANEPAQALAQNVDAVTVKELGGTVREAKLREKEQLVDTEKKAEVKLYAAPAESAAASTSSSRIARMNTDGDVAAGLGTNGAYLNYFGGMGGSARGTRAGGAVSGEMHANLGAVNGDLSYSDKALGVTGLPAAPLPSVAGIRSIRIDIPKSGQAFNFTKVLNVGAEPLAIGVSVMKTRAYEIMRTSLQLLAFLVGLFLIWRQATMRSSFWLAMGWSLSLGAIISLLVTLRALHVLFIAALPTTLLLAFLWLLVKAWRAIRPARTVSGEEPGTVNLPASPSPIPPAVGAIAILFFLQMLSAGTVSAATTNAVSIVSATYSGTVHERVAQLDAAIELSSVATNQTVLLFGEDVAIEKFTVKTGEAKLSREGKSVGVVLPSPGAVTLQMKLLVKLGGDVTRRHLAFDIPPALASQFAVSIDETEADVEFPTAVSFKRTSENQQTRVEAYIGSVQRVEMNWTPRVKRAAEIAATVFCQNNAQVTVGSGVVNTRAVLNYHITQGELRQARVRLPAGHRLLRVDGESIRTWQLQSEGGNDLLAVELLKGVSPDYRLVVETEKVLEKLPTQTKVEIPHALEVKRETGLIAVRGGEELSLTPEAGADLQRVDAAEFARVSGEKTGDIISAYRFLKTDFALTIKAEAIQPQVEAVVRNTTRIGLEQINLSARIDYTIKRAGVFSLRIALPAGYRLDNVIGSQIQQWNERTENNNRLLEVTLSERIMGAYGLRLELSQTIKTLPDPFTISGVHPQGTEKLSGFVSVAAEAGISVKTSTFDGLTEIPAASLGESKPGGSSVLAYKFLANDSTKADEWKLAVSTESVESWVRAEIVDIVTLSETLASGKVLVRYDIQNAPVKEFKLRVPAACKNVEIYGANIRRRDQDGEEWRVELQNKVRGQYLLTLTWEQPRSASTNSMSFTGVEALGAERETGSLAILAKSPLQVAEKSKTGELVKIDTRELPEWAGLGNGTTSGGDSVVLSYRYLRPGYQLGLNVNRFDEAAVLQALVDNAHLTTVVADDGQMMTEVSLAIRNNGRQYLEIELPDGATVWSAFVGGRPVRPSKREGKLLLPLERTGTDDPPVNVELTYVSAEKFPKTKGEVNMISPRLDVPLKNARWDLYLPPDFDYNKFGGSMTHTAEAMPISQTYSVTTYNEQEVKQQQVRREEVSGYFQNARRQLAAGNIKELNRAFKQVKDNALNDEFAERDLKELAKDVSRVQSSNLISAQNAFTLDNYEKFGVQVEGQALMNPANPGSQGGNGGQNGQNGRVVDYDQDVAEQQWNKLQQAQELAVAKVQPLRVNLPTRGMLHSFTQVLQTEVKKPMTIQLNATSNKQVNWFSRIIATITGFLLLWMLVSSWLNRSNSANAKAQPA